MSKRTQPKAPATKPRAANKPQQPKKARAKRLSIPMRKTALLQALEASLGIVTTACKAVGVDRTVFYEYKNTDPEFAAAVKELEEVSIDFVESKLFKQIEEGNVTAAIFYLKTKGKRRGYIERQEVSGPDGGPMAFQGFKDAPFPIGYSFLPTEQTATVAVRDEEGADEE